MSLIYDPSALRHSTQQVAYGQTWTYINIQVDGYQVWRSGEGKEAMVPRLDQRNVK